MEIAGELKEDASVDTQVSLDFMNMEVNGTYTLPGNTVFKYEFLPNPKRSTLIAFIAPPSPALTSVVNSTNDWANGQLNFSAGTIKVNQEWVVNFTLRALIEGNIKVFNRRSKVTFNGTEGEVGIPDTYITAIQPGTEKGPEGIEFNITNLRRTNQPSDTQIAQLAWDTFYNGFDRNITWTIYIAPPHSDAFGQVDDPFSTGRAESPWKPLFIGDLKPGSYTVKVKGHVNDANDAEKTVPLIIPEPKAAPQILIQ
jgi:hypothetical protein